MHSVKLFRGYEEVRGGERALSVSLLAFVRKNMLLIKIIIAAAANID